MASRTSANGKGPFIDQLSETDGLWKLWYSVTDNADHVVEGWSPEFIVDRHAPTPTVNNVKELREMLFNDLRIDEEEFNILKKFIQIEK